MNKQMFWITMVVAVTGLWGAPTGWRVPLWAVFCFLFFIYYTLERIEEKIR